MILRKGDITYRVWSFWQRGTPGSFRYNSDGLGLGNGVHLQRDTGERQRYGGFRRLGWELSSFFEIL